MPEGMALKMEIIELTEETRGEYITCLEDWSGEIKDGVYRKECWCTAMLDKGLRVKLARNDSGVIAGMIQYVPIEQSWIEGENLYFVCCIWVHGHKMGRGDLRKKGIGTALLHAAEEDVKTLNAKGLVVWGLLLPLFMRAGWFRKHGYKKVDRNGISVLLWKPFSDDASPPRWIKAKKKPVPVPGRVLVTALVNGWCTGVDGMVERARRICGEFGERVIYREIPTGSREVVREWGLTDALFVNDRNIYKGPPLTSEKIRSEIERRVRKL